jgi:hypothetical protein
MPDISYATKKEMMHMNQRMWVGWLPPQQMQIKQTWCIICLDPAISMHNTPKAHNPSNVWTWRYAESLGKNALQLHNQKKLNRLPEKHINSQRQAKVAYLRSRKH